MTSRVNKQLVARRFGRCAHVYDNVTPVQQQMALHLSNEVGKRLAHPPGTTFELGCGTGRLTRLLVDLYPDSHLTVIDIAEEMVSQTQSDFPEVDAITADAETYVSNAPEDLDLVISNATVQWFEHPAVTAQSWREKLKTNGLLAFATFGNDTFHELRTAFDHAYGSLKSPRQQHVLAIPAGCFWRDNFPEIELIEEYVELTFPTVRAFLKSVQKAGATHAPDGNRAMSRQLYREMTTFYEENFSDESGNIIATYHIFYIFLKRQA